MFRGPRGRKGQDKKKKEPIVAISIDIATRQVTELTQKELDKINEEIKKERDYQKCVDDVESELDHKVQRTHEKAIENAENIMSGGVSGATITSPLILIGTGITTLLNQRSLARDIESINNSRITEIKKRCGTR